ncbi:MAG TPA: ribonuclease HII [Hungateiclostridium thermocellum]|jgi:ribonuclease HII|nr:ribonuclease HII [Acetivibrio thermocellus]ADU74523.1 Ribonuclease H [Acetivibrio thermocellus DSM 1313]ANV76215.1 Ribonuclease HII [Acetivibrio thermocellus DSM 2360]ALX08466.1 Ribonuclease HII [Acetivibrio thermocellus AD2]EIC05407.1 ribonuclease HII/HIII [Acetivibrio thermocellus YS]PFH02739.1 RNase HII [Acetivibrio thermocellus AD2]
MVQKKMGNMTVKQIEKSVEGLDLDKALEKLYCLKAEFGDRVDKIIEKYEKKKLKYEKELNRYLEMCIYEKEAYQRGYKLIAGIDEAGRGPLAGPVVAAAVILPQDVFIEGLNDSKKLTENQREKLFDVINDKAIGVGIGIVDEKQIDEINILNATKKAMKLAVGNLKPVPDILFIDSLKLDDINIEQNSIVKGDAKSVSIAAASIIAKVTRDRILREMDKKYPMYGFARHKGYGTGEHIEAIKKYGICPIHRVSFTKNFIV